MNREVFIYGLIDPRTNQLRYIGKSINPKLRLRKHISERNLHDSYKDRWLRKLHENNLKPELIIIDLVTIDDWKYWEIFYILYFKSIGCILTNATNGGDEPPSTKGRKHTEEAKIKMSKTKKGKSIPWLNSKPRTEKHKENLGKAHKGKLSNKKGKTYEEIYGDEIAFELREKLSNSHKWQKNEKHPMYGKKHSKETKEKLSSHFSKKVFQFSLDGVFIKEFESAKIAEKETGISSNIIKNTCLNKNKKNGKFKWGYNK
jgi:group I intron endonuclease